MATLQFRNETTLSNLGLNSLQFYFISFKKIKRLRLETSTVSVVCPLCAGVEGKEGRFQISKFHPHQTT